MLIVYIYGLIFGDYTMNKPCTEDTITAPDAAEVVRENSRRDTSESFMLILPGVLLAVASEYSEVSVKRSWPFRVPIMAKQMLDLLWRNSRK